LTLANTTGDALIDRERASGTEKGSRFKHVSMVEFSPRICRYPTCLDIAAPGRSRRAFLFMGKGRISVGREYNKDDSARIPGVKVGAGTCGGDLQCPASPGRRQLQRQHEEINSALASLGCVNETGAQLGIDQRGAARPSVNRFCDAGAFEFGAVAPPDDVIFRNGFDTSG
jgi:hypothetical protein